MTRRFFPSRGIRRGDPLSAYLFIITADVLSRVIIKAVNEEELVVIKMKRSYPMLSHLFFANDSLFFAKIERLNLLVLKEILSKYSKASG